MFVTYDYSIRNKKTGEYSHISVYSPLEGKWIGWGVNPDGSSAEWDVLGVDYADIHTDSGGVLTVPFTELCRLYADLEVVFGCGVEEENF